MSELKTEMALELQPQLKFSYDDEIFINYEKIGTGDKSVLFLHGFGLSLFSWEDTRSCLHTEGYTFYFLDLKGFGFSYKGRIGDYSVEEQANIIAAFISNLNLNKVTLIGHSYGGMIALYLLYLNHNNKLGICCEKLILLDTPAFSDAQPFFLKALRNPILNFISFKILSPRMNAAFTIKNTFHNKEQALNRYLDTYEFFFKQSGAKRAMTLAAKNIYPDNIEGLTNYYSSIKIPTLIIWGKNDTLIPLQFGENLQKVLGNATLVVIADCGHVPNEEKPKITSEYINKFLEQKL